ncbi:PhaM family polyhydroxyalkanoate granule multifunctional regulatory protein [Ottowia sp.]|uniref:PhaM family polyhydroxyalkanoate granule multifunctional regulatory protein n=1 Tax=Ottowia sp. TaxID=1898956 RepID=UPI003A895E49
MSAAQPFDFGKFVPGFDFLQKLANQRGATGAGAGLPGLGGWIAPTVSVEELDKRINELKAVQFWLDQNSTALKATIQALQVQRMTLATLSDMNMNMAEVTKAFSMPAAAPVAAAPASTPAAASAQWPFTQPMASATTAVPSMEAPAPEPEPESEPEAAPAARAQPARTSKRQSAAKSTSDPTSAMADPMQWWGALTQQFQNIAASALREAAHNAPLDEAGSAEDASQSAASGVGEASAKSQKAAQKTTGRKKPAPKAKTTSRTAKSISKSAAKKASPSRAKGAKPAARTPRAQLLGWPLPPPFKTSR